MCGESKERVLDSVRKTPKFQLGGAGGRGMDREFLIWGWGEWMVKLTVDVRQGRAR